jgi:cysteine synthase A
MPAAIERAGELLNSLPGAVQPSQFENPANPKVHAVTTAEKSGPTPKARSMSW